MNVSKIENMRANIEKEAAVVEEQVKLIKMRIHNQDYKNFLLNYKPSTDYIKPTTIPARLENIHRDLSQKTVFLSRLKIHLAMLEREPSYGITNLSDEEIGQVDLDKCDTYPLNDWMSEQRRNEKSVAAENDRRLSAIKRASSFLKPDLGFVPDYPAGTSKAVPPPPPHPKTREQELHSKSGSLSSVAHSISECTPIPIKTLYFLASMMDSDHCKLIPYIRRVSSQHSSVSEGMNELPGSISPSLMQLILSSPRVWTAKNGRLLLGDHLMPDSLGRGALLYLQYNQCYEDQIPCALLWLMYLQKQDAASVNGLDLFSGMKRLDESPISRILLLAQTLTIMKVETKDAIRKKLHSSFLEGINQRDVCNCSNSG